MKKYVIGSAVILVVIIASLFFYYSNNNYSNLLPMYGSDNYEQYILKRANKIKEIDDDFLRVSLENRDSKQVFKEIIDLAWSYLSKNDSDTAMKRCNQAWLVDHENFNVDWCYGAILGYKKDLDLSAYYFEKALSNYSTSSAFSEDAYIRLYRDSALTFINLSDENLDINNERAKLYATKAIDLLNLSLEDKNLPKNAIPSEKMMLAVAKFNYGSYDEARKIYISVTKEYPELLNNSQIIEFSEELKQKGY